jgi:serine/threonine protein kinase
MVERRADRSGQTLGRYRLTRLLGAGGFGEVYEADHQLLQQKRAIKLLLERYFHDPNQRERFLREARTLATLDHLNIAPVMEVGEEGDVLYLVMPFYHRGTLHDFLKQRTTPLPLIEVEHYLEQMCAAVGYAHTKHIAHLDLKPDNMLLHEDGRLVLSDFGLAHLIKQGRLEAGSSASWGTPHYMAPEQIRGEPEVRSDIYALGVILYQLLTNQRPFTGTTPEAVMMKHLLDAPPLLHIVSPAASAALEPVLRKVLEKKPEKRHATADKLLEDFRTALSGSLPRASHSAAPRVSFMAPTLQMNSPTPTLGTTVQQNTTQATAAICQIDSCGVLAVGRCATCKRTFCTSHQARSGQTRYIDQCAPCLAQAQVDEEKRIQEVEAKLKADEAEARKYIQSGSARIALFTSGMQSVNIYKTRQKEKKGFFGQNHRWVEEIASVRRGWILGAILVEYLAPMGESSLERTSDTQLIALLDLDHRLILTPVKPYAESYKEADIGYQSSWEISDIGWIEAERAVRQLIELHRLGIQSIFTRSTSIKQDENAFERMQALAGKVGCIRIEEGKEPGRIYKIHEKLSIGPDRERDIVLEDFDPNQLHATVIHQGNGYYVLETDSWSSNIKVNEQPLPPNKSRMSHTYLLQDGDHISFENFHRRGQPIDHLFFAEARDSLRRGQPVYRTVLVFETR